MKWKKYRDCFYNRCRNRAHAESDPTMEEKLVSMGRKVKKIDDEMERHSELLKEIQDNPTDVNAIVARRRKDFTEEFFRHLNLLSEVYDGLEDRDAMARLGARCLSAVSAYDNTLEYVDTLDMAQAKFDDILDSPSIDVACEKIKSLAKAKELDSSLVLLINSAWASAKESTTMKNEVKDIMFHLYKATKSSLRSIVTKEIKLLKHLLNITDPEERFSALATAFCPGDDNEAKDPKAIYTTPKELHKWIKIMLDAYHLNAEETDLREAKQMTQPVVIQRLFILKETIEEEYLEQSTSPDSQTEDTKLLKRILLFMILETEWKGFPSGTKVAAAGGVTTLVDMPLNNFPSTVPRETLELKLKAVESRIYVDVSGGGLVPENAFKKICS
ncbi:hypothetical protein M0R45_034531 [Rubus argutus]|uniref:Uncharacterized protein n=1 Tax=Rubus argutus TaxID=59490 RepID=A0AAW1VRQ5_RUBAR